MSTTPSIVGGVEAQPEFNVSVASATLRPEMEINEKAMKEARNNIKIEVNAPFLEISEQRTPLNLHANLSNFYLFHKIKILLEQRHSRKKNKTYKAKQILN